MQDLLQYEVIRQLLRFGWSALVSLVIQGSVVLLATHLLIAVFGERMSAAGRHRVWCLALCGMFLVPILSHYDLSYTTSADEAHFELLQDRRASTQLGPIVSRQVVDLGGQTQNHGIANGTLFPLVLLMIWVAGLISALANILREMLALRRLACLARPFSDRRTMEILSKLVKDLRIRRPIQLVTIRNLATPVTWGGWQPYLALPESASSWTKERLEMALMHELVHIKRLDVPVHGLIRFACALVWFNPLVWRAAAASLLEREKACDDAVLLAGVDATDYAEGLVDLARDHLHCESVTCFIPAMARPSELRQRLGAILSSDIQRRPAEKKTLIAGSMCLLFIISLSYALLPQSATSKPFAASILAPETQASGLDGRHFIDLLDQSFAAAEEDPEIAHDVAFMMLRIKEHFLTGRAHHVETMFMDKATADRHHEYLNQLYLSELESRIDSYVPTLLVRGLASGPLQAHTDGLLMSGQHLELYNSLLAEGARFKSSHYRPHNYFSPSPSLGMTTPNLGGLAAFALVLSGENIVQDLATRVVSRTGTEASNSAWALNNVIWPDQRELVDTLFE